jgi:arginase
MSDRFILSPYFLDAYQPEIAKMADQDWRVIRASMPEGGKTTRMGALYRALAGEVSAAVAAGERPVSIAGDCCATIGVMAGLQHAGLEPTLIWMDAHGDFNTHDTSPSGFLGGMPLAMAVGLGEQTLLESVSLRPWPESKVILADARDLDPEERESVALSGITHLPDIEMLLAPGVIPDGPLYVHFDCDVINPDEAPAMSYPAPGGPSSEQVRDVVRALAATGRVAAVSICLWTPSLDADGVTQAVVQGAINALLGR